MKSGKETPSFSLDILMAGSKFTLNVFISAVSHWAESKTSWAGMWSAWKKRTVKYEAMYHKSLVQKKLFLRQFTNLRLSKCNITIIK
jgi:hypothetical protein